MVSSSILAFLVRPARRGLTAHRAAVVLVVLVTGFLFFRVLGTNIQEQASTFQAVLKKPSSAKWNDGPEGAQIPGEKLGFSPTTRTHPINALISKANKDFDETMNKETRTLELAAAAYRKKRGRHPPPGFDVWFQFASSNHAVIIEDFFDQIYHDLSPFWGLPATTIRREAWDYEMTINVRDGNATAGSDWFWTRIWLDMIKTVEHMLPDMDIPLNAMDEPRLVVAWETIDRYMRTERKMSDPPNMTNNIGKLPPPSEGNLDVKTRNKQWSGKGPYWEHAIRGCHPQSLARQAPSMTSFDHRPIIDLIYTKAHMLEGFVFNCTASANYCDQPDLQGLHGAFIEPLSISTSSVLFPIFGGSKLQTNNDILMPAPMYWANEERFSGGDNHGLAWADKEDMVTWRGIASGGRNKAENWKAFQRHRLLAMLNSTIIAMAEAGQQPQNFDLPQDDEYNLAALSANQMSEWVHGWSDTGFVGLNCYTPASNSNCSYVNKYYHEISEKTMAEQFNAKYLPDIDGNSFSGRYRGFLLSTSLPIKATVFHEWHDSRLFPWKHFVPMDNRFVDLWGIMEFFVGFRGGGIEVEGHDAAAERIASEGKEWAERVLRREDMSIYVLRLLLEYARISRDERDELGYVADLLDGGA